MVYKKAKKKWGAMGSSIIEADTEEEAYEEYYNYLINKGLIQ